MDRQFGISCLIGILSAIISFFAFLSNGFLAAVLFSVGCLFLVMALVFIIVTSPENSKR